MSEAILTIQIVSLTLLRFGLLAISLRNRGCQRVITGRVPRIDMRALDRVLDLVPDPDQACADLPGWGHFSLRNQAIEQRYADADVMRRLNPRHSECGRAVDRFCHFLSFLRPISSS